MIYAICAKKEQRFLFLEKVYGMTSLNRIKALYHLWLRREITYR